MEKDIEDDHRQLCDVGERYIVRRIIQSLQSSPLVIDGLGNDAAFVDMSVSRDEILVVNTDRSGLNIAYQLGLAGADSIGDLGVSHAVSDVVAAGGQPKIVTIALLLPPETEVGFVLDVMKGAERAAHRYGAIVVGGDTKKNPKFAIVVTAIGTALKENRLGRATAQIGDFLAVTGNLGSMLLGTLAYGRRLQVPTKIKAVLDEALTQQHPPYEVGRALSDAGVANACIDISDGLSGAIYALCGASAAGAVIDERKIPINPALQEFSQALGIRPAQLALAGGDWQYLYSIPPAQLREAERIATSHGGLLSIIGRVIRDPELIVARNLNGEYRHLARIEHDSFRDISDGQSYFHSIGEPLVCLGDVVDDQIIARAMRF